MSNAVAARMPHWAGQLARRLLACCSLLLAAAAVAAPAPPYQARPLQQLLEAFKQDADFALVYSADLVTPDLRVRNEPAAGSTLEVLEALLLQHGLTLRAADGVYFVVRTPATAAAAPRGGTILIVIKDAASGARLDLAEAAIDPGGANAAALGAGAYQFNEVAPGGYRVIVERPGYQAQERRVQVAPGAVRTVVVHLALQQDELQRVTVTASRYDLLHDIRQSLAYISQDEIENMPDLGDDPVRAAHRLPGTASGGISAKSHIRGGEEDEVLLVFDGLDLVDPFHVRDYQSVFSTIDQRAISSVEIYTGGFPVNYGDRLSGVMRIDTLDPEPGYKHEIGLSVFNTSLLSTGRFASDRGEWLASARRSNLDLVIDPKFGEPSFSDVLLHVGMELNVDTQLSLNALLANDAIHIITENKPEDREDARSDTRNNQVWLKWDQRWSGPLSSSTVFSYGSLSNHRRGGVGDEEKIIGSVTDRRKLDTLGIKTDWQWAAPRHLLKWGAQFRDQEADYDYFSAVDFFGFFASFPDAQPIRRDFALATQGQNYGFYGAHRFKASEALTTEVGLRWDRQTWAGDGQLSPRLSALYRLGPATDLRISWGRFYQSQRLHDLQLEDGVDRFFRAQRADHAIVGLEHRFGSNISGRIEVFQKDMSDLHPRYENLYDPLELLPELHPDRVTIAPDTAQARGVELFFSGRRKAINWWASYSLSRVEDEMNGIDVPRSWDQRHSFSGGLVFSGARWTLSAAMRWHSGWPSTELSIHTDVPADDELGYRSIPGPRNAERLDSFQSIDVRASRRFDVPRGSLVAFIEISNVFDRTNACCVDFDVEPLDNGTFFLERAEETWLPRIPAIGIRWEF